MSNTALRFIDISIADGNIIACNTSWSRTMRLYISAQFHLKIFSAFHSHALPGVHTTQSLLTKHGQESMLMIVIRLTHASISSGKR